ncbi:recombinase family protein [Luteolibacter pohnpeiensis]|uniref:Recombinase family protein n=1 Tax=Luteolibacter pohnpeiensis TaxID=454153 RepID=A0A934SD42_9BACT|nr:recombinase family protein [Luteolibacter pohnpeiensis]MBK1883674.1 recombinase family protein [Luteolibacter pohnpeiensis]
MKTIPVAILVRVSTAKQETDRQISELQQVAEAKGWTVIETVKEHGVSGSSQVRPGLDRVLELAEAGKIRKILVHEVSRIARRNSIAHTFLDQLEDLKVSLYWHAQGIETLLPNGRRNPGAGIMFSLLAEMARAEKETLVERINSGLAEARRKGKTLGRPVGSSMDAKALIAKHDDIARAVRAGKSLRDIAARTGKGLATVKRVKAAMKAKS